MKKEEGFTLIETLLVLFLVTLILTFPMVHFSKIRTESEAQLFFESFRSSVTLMQNHAVLNNNRTIMETKPANREVHFRVHGIRNHPIEHKLKLPDSLSFAGASNEYSFVGETGNQGNLHRFRIQTSTGLVEIGFHMGSGRLTIEEL